MWVLVLQLFLPFTTHAQPIDLLAHPTRMEGSVTRAASGSSEFDAGPWSFSAVYQQLELAGKSFTIMAEVTRTRGQDGIGFVFPVGSQKVAAVFGGWNGRYDGLNTVNGYDPSSKQNPTSKCSAILNGKKIQIRISVTPKRIAVYVDGNLHFQIDPTQYRLNLNSRLRGQFDDGIGFYIVNGHLIVNQLTIEQIL